MRLTVIKEASDLQSLSHKLFNDTGKAAAKVAARDATLERIKALNPHVDFRRIEKGTVLLLPDATELRNSESRSIEGDAFDDFAKRATEGFGIVAERIRSATKASAADNAAVTAAEQTDVIRRQFHIDPLLQPQLRDAGEEFAAEQKQAQEALKQGAAMQKALEEELGALQKLMR